MAFTAATKLSVSRLLGHPVGWTDLAHRQMDAVEIPVAFAAALKLPKYS